MKKYKIPHSVNANLVSGKEVNVIPALAGAVGVLAGVAATGVAFESGRQVSKKIFGDDRFISTSRGNSLLKVITID